MSAEVKFTEYELNLLQCHGIISDNCVDSEDVAEPDRTKAVEWLQKRARLLKEDPLI